MVNIGSLSEAIGTTNTAAASVLTASSELTATAETLSREVEAFFRNLRADTFDEMRKTGTDQASFSASLQKLENESPFRHGRA